MCAYKRIHKIRLVENQSHVTIENRLYNFEVHCCWSYNIYHQIAEDTDIEGYSTFRPACSLATEHAQSIVVSAKVVNDEIISGLHCNYSNIEITVNLKK